MLNVQGKMQEAFQHEDWHNLWKIHGPPNAKHLL
jgi:hypothetical protein